jgi:diguanylate cyclase (GGDEF)-like protein
MADDHEKLSALNKVAWELNAANTATALTLAQEAQQLARELADVEGLAQSLRTIGLCQVAQLDYESARASLLEALQLLETLDPPVRETQVEVLRKLLENAFYLKDYESALAYGIKALPLCRELQDRKLEALTLNDVGIIYGNLDAYEESLEHLLASLNILESLQADDKSLLANPLNNIGNLYEKLGNKQRALEFFKASLAVFEQEGRGKGITLGNIGRIYVTLGEYDLALDYLQESREFFEGRDDSVYLAPALAKIGDAYAESGDDAKAMAYYKRSLATVRASPYGEFKDEILASLGRFYLRQGAYEAAVPHLEAALAIVEKAGTKQGIYEAYFALSEAYEGLGDTARALHHYKKFRRFKEEVFSEASNNKVRSLMAQFDVERAQKEREIYRLQHVELVKAYEKLKLLYARLEQQSQKLERLSSQDALTGLYNRRYLDKRLGEEFRRARRYGHSLSVAVIDLDAFKSINDKFSHAAGDKVLRAVAKILRRNLRETDIIARYGGEEFVVVFVQTPLPQAVQACEKIRRAVARCPWRSVNPELCVTLSIGLSDDLGVLNHERFLHAADKKLYEAKRGGRNRVCY